MARLQGKRCLVTGGSGGIGAATCLELARGGARGVAVQYMGSKERAEQVAEQCRKLGSDSFAVQADVAKREPCDAMVRQCVERWGGLDVLLCLAGDPWRAQDWFAPFPELRDEAFEKAFRIDLLGSVHCAQAALPVMQRGKGGRVVFIASSPALTGDVEGLSYLAAKAGLVALAKSLARLYGRDNVTVNALALGSVRTAAMGGLSPEDEARLSAETALGRQATPEEVARVAAWLCSEEAGFITGVVLPVDGGLSFH